MKKPSTNGSAVTPKKIAKDEETLTEEAGSKSSKKSRTTEINGVAPKTPKTPKQGENFFLLLLFELFFQFSGLFVCGRREPDRGDPKEGSQDPEDPEAQVVKRNC